MTEPTEESAERIRAMLADLGHADATTGMPDDVRARLDDVVAQQRPSAGIPLRRRTTTWVAAAAAVLVVGVGAGAVLNRHDSTSDSAGSAASSPESARSTPSGPGSAGTTSSPPAALQQDETTTRQGQAPSRSLPVLRPDSVAADIRALLARDDTSAARGRVAAQPDAGGCTALPEPRPGQEQRLVSFRGEPALLLVQRERAVLVRCDGSALLQVDLKR